MGRRRKQHKQLSLAKVEHKPDKNGQWRGGPRPGAGRKPNGAKAGASHARRPELDPTHPLHVTLRVVAGIGWLREAKAYQAIRCALRTVLEHHVRFRIVHFSLQGDHLHLICEAAGKEALATGMRSFEIAAAKHLHREFRPKGQRRRRGKVFADRYHVEVLDSIARTRNALSYVLNNWRKHRQDRRTAGLFDGRIDPYSSGVYFLDWKERTIPELSIPPDYAAPEIGNAHTWMLTIGYKRGRPISVYDVPGAESSSGTSVGGARARHS